MNPRDREAVESCPVFEASQILGKKWAILVLQTLMTPEADNGLRFNEIQKEVSWVSPKVLTQRLREFEDEALLLREVDASEVPVKVSYTLTAKGQDLTPVVEAMQKWGLKHGTAETSHCLGEGLRQCYGCRAEVDD
ncbi:transcriptional regulator [Candidatus Thorarchaeota archaeon]|nr:MAG: transcriptional regulator [Candidatus Thorarchaeota archaeon]